MKKAYISGPMTGLKELNKPSFDKAETFINNIKHIPINPHNLFTSEEKRMNEGNWHYFMKKDLKAMIDCDYVLLLPAWKQSNGAIYEYLTAARLDIPAYYLSPIFEKGFKFHTIDPVVTPISTISDILEPYNIKRAVLGFYELQRLTYKLIIDLEKNNLVL